MSVILARGLARSMRAAAPSFVSHLGRVWWGRHAQSHGRDWAVPVRLFASGRGEVINPPEGGGAPGVKEAPEPETVKDMVWVGDAFVKNQVDSSSDVTMQAPYGHDENKALATQLGIEGVYEYSDMGAISRVTVAFQGRSQAAFDDLEAFVVADGEAKLTQVPQGSVNLMRLPDEVTQHFTNLKLPYCAHCFESNTEGVSDTLALSFETPGGYWTLGWHLPAELFRKEPDIFFYFIQSVRVTPRQQVFQRKTME